MGYSGCGAWAGVRKHVVGQARCRAAMPRSRAMASSARLTTSGVIRFAGPTTLIAEAAPIPFHSSGTATATAPRMVSPELVA